MNADTAAVMISAIAAVTGALMSFFNYFRIMHVYRATNGMRDELVEEARRLGDAIGHARGLIDADLKNRAEQPWPPLQQARAAGPIPPSARCSSSCCDPSRVSMALAHCAGF